MCPDVKSGFYLTETSELGDKKPRKLFLMCGKCSALATENHPAEYIGAAVWNIKETPKLSSGYNTCELSVVESTDAFGKLHFF